MKAFGVLLAVGLISQASLAADSTAALMPLTDSQPAQQFVTADSPNAANTRPEAAPAASAEPSAPALSNIPSPSPMPAANSGSLAPKLTAPVSAATALGLGASKEEPAENSLLGGLDIPNFVRCKQTVLASCNRVKDLNQFQQCFTRIPAKAACQQFIAFATAVGLAPQDDVDLIKHYNAGQLDLLHLIRYGANYPGVYYALGTNGELIDLIFGPQTQGLDIRKDIHYPEIAARFPKVELFSIVDKLPQVQSTADGTGLRLVFRFQLLNGCHACERAGYAFVAYDFSETGTLKSATIDSLQPIS